MIESLLIYHFRILTVWQFILIIRSIVVVRFLIYKAVIRVTYRKSQWEHIQERIWMRRLILYRMG